LATEDRLLTLYCVFDRFIRGHVSVAISQKDLAVGHRDRDVYAPDFRSHVGNAPHFVLAFLRMGFYSGDIQDQFGAI